MKAKSRGDFILFFVVLILIVFGAVMVFSASYYETIALGGNPFSYLVRVSAWAAAGLVLMFALTFVPYRIYYAMAPVMLLVGIALLCLLFTPLGTEINSARRWIQIGPVTIMPGEIAKITAIWFVAYFYTKNKAMTRSLRRGFMPILILTLIYFVLIYKEPNLSTALILVGIIFSMIFLAGGNLAHIGSTLIAGGVGIVFLLVSGANEEHTKRFTGFLHPFEDAQGEFYQTVQGLLALGSGGVYGVGPGNGIQKALYLPFAQNDFIFAVIGEELGFLGCSALLLVYLILIWRCVQIAMNAPDRFAMLVASGITVMLALQVILNVAVVTALMPP
ncbi:MAG: putative lipid II flippase FtsW, partial [Clostridiales Family XIII bacterium]|nr:putative lipid II flippase FtsW [Clostridiales Family XIII bacterium]